MQKFGDEPSEIFEACSVEANHCPATEQATSSPTFLGCISLPFGGSGRPGDEGITSQLRKA